MLHMTALVLHPNLMEWKMRGEEIMPHRDHHSIPEVVSVDRLNGQIIHGRRIDVPPHPSPGYFAQFSSQALSGPEIDMLAVENAGRSHLQRVSNIWLVGMLHLEGIFHLDTRVYLEVVGIGCKIGQELTLPKRTVHHPLHLYMISDEAIVTLSLSLTHAPHMHKRH